MCRYDPSSSAREEEAPNGRIESVRTIRRSCCRKYAIAPGSERSIDKRKFSIAASRPLPGGDSFTAEAPKESRATSRRLRTCRMTRSTIPRTSSLYRSNVARRFRPRSNSVEWISSRIHIPRLASRAGIWRTKTARRWQGPAGTIHANAHGAGMDGPRLP